MAVAAVLSGKIVLGWADLEGLDKAGTACGECSTGCSRVDGGTEWESSAPRASEESPHSVSKAGTPPAEPFPCECTMEIGGSKLGRPSMWVASAEGQSLGGQPSGVASAPHGIEGAAR